MFQYVRATWPLIAVGFWLGCDDDATQRNNSKSVGGRASLSYHAGTAGTSTTVSQGGSLANTVTTTKGGTAADQNSGTDSQGTGGVPAANTTTAPQVTTPRCVGAATLGTVSPSELSAMSASPSREFLLINVHTGATSNVPGTNANIDYTDIAALEAYIGSDKGKSVVIYCLSDHMAKIAGPRLVTDGYCHIRYLEGGLSAWSAAGYPVSPL